jgi:hypothetical protein
MNMPIKRYEESELTKDEKVIYRELIRLEGLGIQMKIPRDTNADGKRFHAGLQPFLGSIQSSETRKEIYKKHPIPTLDENIKNINADKMEFYMQDPGFNPVPTHATREDALALEPVLIEDVKRDFAIVYSDYSESYKTLLASTFRENKKFDEHFDAFVAQRSQVTYLLHDVSNRSGTTFLELRTPEGDATFLPWKCRHNSPREIVNWFNNMEPIAAVAQDLGLELPAGYAAYVTKLQNQRLYENILKKIEEISQKMVQSLQTLGTTLLDSKPSEAEILGTGRLLSDVFILKCKLQNSLEVIHKIKAAGVQSLSYEEQKALNDLSEHVNQYKTCTQARGAEANKFFGGGEAIDLGISPDLSIVETLTQLSSEAPTTDKGLSL